MAAVTRGYFTAAFAVCLAAAAGLARAAHLAPVAPARAQAMSVSAARACFRWLMLAPCPWIRLRGARELVAALEAAARESDGAPYVLANHNSPMDSLLVAALLPDAVGRGVRSLVKAALLDEPLFGSLCKDCGTVRRGRLSRQVARYSCCVPTPL